ncbi:uncharacterized protein LOC125164920 [Prionailurus viverrinus]|uniref:uncharacterized protein LOC125164920 n=1 Tax=Prionailurus viverrinus TaxID=61388 RepID=UPI001FF5D751|nr:uncharacterized protein LOC125164920 [Prionailurus viverrinus]
MSVDGTGFKSRPCQLCELQQVPQRPWASLACRHNRDGKSTSFGGHWKNPTTPTPEGLAVAGASLGKPVRPDLAEPGGGVGTREPAVPPRGECPSSSWLTRWAWTPPQCPPPGEWRGQLWKVLGKAHPHSPAPGRGDLDDVAARDENPAVSLPGRAPGRRRLPRRRPPASCSPVAPRALERGASQENGCSLHISPAGEDTEAQSSSAIRQTSHTQLCSPPGMLSPAAESLSR